MTHFDYVEVGAADFETVLQRAERLDLRGVTVEPVGHYLDRLPEVEGCRKVKAAIGRKAGATAIHWLDPEVLESKGLPGWLKGCSRVGKTHKLVKKALEAAGIDEGAAVRMDEVPMLTFRMLAEQEGIGSIDYLKIDAEGMDREILESWLEAAAERPGLLAPLVMAETSSFPRKCNPWFLDLRARIEALGYETGLGDSQNVIWRR